jgi:hypothetical protein
MLVFPLFGKTLSIRGSDPELPPCMDAQSALPEP